MRTATFENNNKKILIIEQKFDEFIKLIDETNLNSRKIKNFEERINTAFQQNKLKSENVEAFEALDNLPDLSRLEMLDNLDVLLSQHQLDSNLTKKYYKKDITKRVLLLVTGVVILILGLSMIIMPAPPYFEMYTVFNFNDHDGITIMDIISLLIILSGIFLIIVNTSKKNSY